MPHRSPTAADIGPYTPPNQTDLSARIDCLERKLAGMRRAAILRYCLVLVLISFLLVTDAGNAVLHVLLLFLTDVRLNIPF